MINTKDIFIIIIVLALIPIGAILWTNNKANANETVVKSLTLNEYVISQTNTSNDSIQITEEEPILEELNVEEIPLKPQSVSVSMNFVGDCTIGSDSNFGYKNTFYDVFEHNEYSYFFSNMQSLFKNDDLTIANLEGTFTDYKTKTAKKFNFRAPPDYANVLLSGDIDVVNIANNHTKDYGQTGFDDTINTLNNYNIPFFGYDNYYIYEKDGIKIGFVGLTSIWEGTIYNRIDNAIAYFNENECNCIIFTFHWGVEREYKQNSTQRKIGQYAIDKGADLVVGHHSHVLQGIEEYNGKYIVYSLANFCFGGNINPPDKDTMVFQYNLVFTDGIISSKEAIIMPARVSSVNNKNDYKPTLSTGDEYYRILNKILKNSNIKTDENGKILSQ